MNLGSSCFGLLFLGSGSTFGSTLSASILATIPPLPPMLGSLVPTQRFPKDPHRSRIQHPGNWPSDAEMFCRRFAQVSPFKRDKNILRRLKTTHKLAPLPTPLVSQDEALGQIAVGSHRLRFFHERCQRQRCSASGTFFRVAEENILGISSPAEDLFQGSNCVH